MVSGGFVTNHTIKIWHYTIDNMLNASVTTVEGSLENEWFIKYLT